MGVPFADHVHVSPVEAMVSVAAPPSALTPPHV
jgi:hypothetical protein